MSCLRHGLLGEAPRDSIRRTAVWVFAVIALVSTVLFNAADLAVEHLSAEPAGPQGNQATAPATTKSQGVAAASPGVPDGGAAKSNVPSQANQPGNGPRGGGQNN